MRGLDWVLTSVVVILCCGSAASAGAQVKSVTVTTQAGMYVLENAYVRAEVDRRTGDLHSLKYAGEELMGYVSGHHAGYWEQNPSGAALLTDGVSIDPANNGGERAEVYVKGVAQGKGISAGGPGDRAGRGMICDLEIRYSLGTDDHGLYTTATFTHPASYGDTSVGESRYGMKLNGQIFDWLSVDARHNALMPSGSDWDHGVPMNMKEARRLTTGVYAGRVEHKYDYSANQLDTRVFGWSSTKKHIGLFIINPSVEYLSGGATKVEMTGHLDDGDGGDPTLLDYWRSTHYGGSSLDLKAGEAWSKTIGPIFLYVNAGSSPQAIFDDARKEGERQGALWPYAWAAGPDFPAAAGRAAVRGRLTVDDPQAPSLKISNLLVGLIPAGEAADGPGGGGEWQRDAKHYQFWTRAATDGSFTIPQVRPGTYELHATADGVMGDYAGAQATVVAGAPLDVGSLRWTPVRYGKQLWEIGVPNRNASEFLMGDQYFHWGMYLQYAKLFPNDVHYVVGKSDWRKDWYFEQVPNVAHGGGRSEYDGGETPWTIDFPYTGTNTGTLVLRTGLCGIAARHVVVSVNGKPVGDLAPLVYNATINRDGIQGTWSEHDLAFPAALLKPGMNRIELRVPAGNALSGVQYDSLRLELVDREGYHPPAAGQFVAP